MDLIQTALWMLTICTDAVGATGMDMKNNTVGI